MNLRANSHSLAGPSMRCKADPESPVTELQFASLSG